MAADVAEAVRTADLHWREVAGFHHAEVWFGAFLMYPSNPDAFCMPELGDVSSRVPAEIAA